MNILLIGGAGYIGSHTAAAFLQAGHRVIIADHFHSHTPASLDWLKQFGSQTPKIYTADALNPASLLKVMHSNRIDSLIYCAGLRSATESAWRPLTYYRANLDGILTTLECMSANNVPSLVFASSAMVYGSKQPPYTETMKCAPYGTPYARSQAFCEQILADAARAFPALSIAILRCFNPAGMYKECAAGKSLQGNTITLIPLLARIAAGKSDPLEIRGSHYPTPDGTCRRDYTHVLDIAKGFVKASEYTTQHKGLAIFNLGRGVPVSILELIHTFEKVNRIRIPYRFTPAQPGCQPDSWADTTKAGRLLGWRPERSLEDICRDTWLWQQRVPD